MVRVLARNIVVLSIATRPLVQVYTKGTQVRSS